MPPQQIFLLQEISGFALMLPLIDNLRDLCEVATAFSWFDLGQVGGNSKAHLGPPMIAMIDPVLVLIVLAVAGVWGIWLHHKRKRHRAVLDSAWREVLADPNYVQRRHLEERRLVAEDAGRRSEAE